MTIAPGIVTAGSAPKTRIDLAGDATATDPWPLFHALREQGPVAWHEVFGRWIVSSDRATRKILSDFKRFTVEGTTVEDLFGADAFISIDDRRRHDDLRNIWAESFRKQGLAALMPALRSIVNELLDPVVEQLRDGESVDVTRAICRPLPTMVIALMMGVPEGAIPDIVRWSDAMAAGGGTYLSEDQKAKVAAAREDAKGALADYLIALLRRRRAAPSGDDLIGTLARSDAGRGLSDDQLVQNLRQLLFAGNETTAKWLAHIFVAYGERPEVQRELAADRAMIGAANDEVMRRVHGGPVEIAGVEMEDGDDITVLPGAANRDPARYAEPDRFDIHRPVLPNLGFGVGFHNCLGSVLAKAEAGLAVNGLFDRIEGWSIAAPYGFSSVPLRGPTPVIITRATA